MKEISITDFKHVLDTNHADTTLDFINVCTPAEYKEKHIIGVRSVPLDTINDRVDEFAGKKTIYVHCRSGRRGQQAIAALAAAGVTAELVNVSGGLMAWEEAGYITNSQTSRLPLMRQVFLAAGILVLASTTAGLVFDTAMLFITLFVGAGLTFSGLTGWCGMALLLSKMPWNE